MEKEIILNLLKQQTAVSEKDLCALTNASEEEVREAIAELQAAHEIAKTKSGKYATARSLGYLKGLLDCKEGGFAFLRTEGQNEDIYIAADDKGGALNGEEVLVKLKPTKPLGKNPEGEVVKILTPIQKEQVGTVHKRRGRVYVFCDDTSIGEVFIPRGKAKEGDIAVITIIRRSHGGRAAQGKIIEILGNYGEAGMDILSCARKFGFREDFPADCLAEARKARLKEEDIAGRKDLRNQKIITIDGADAKDLDDAVSLRILENGNFELGVHIADVSHYVREDSALDKEACSRGTSVYLADRVIPMLPPELSNGVCSLHPGEDKLTLSCMMEIDREGNTVSHTIEESVIRTAHRLTYDGVNQFFDGKREGAFEDVREMLERMNELAKILSKRRFEKGSLDFHINEAKITLDSTGAPIDVSVRERGDSEKMIEEFMLRANVTVAEHYYYIDVPFLYRIHEPPDTEKIQELAVFLKNFGIPLKGVRNIHPHALQTVLQKVEGTPEETIVNSVVLRALNKARYSVEPVPHFGLAAERYCHFTSPIRRYPDLQDHRIIKTLLSGRGGNTYREHLEERLPEVAKKSSEREKSAVDAERAVEDMKAAEYMSDRIGSVHDAVVSGVTKFGIFAELENTIEGMISLSSLTDDYYVYLEKEYCVEGRDTKRRITLGDRVKVKVAGADVSAGKIEFTFA